MLKGSEQITEIILDIVKDGCCDANSLERRIIDYLHSNKTSLYFASREEIRNHIDAEIAFGRLQSKQDVLYITEKGYAKLTKLKNR